jgi:CRISPR-associated protein Csd2
MKNKAIKNVYNFLIIFDVENGSFFDDGASGYERIVRMVKEHVESIKNNAPGYEIFAEEAHRDKMEKVYRSFVSKSKKNKQQQITPERQLQKWICKRYFDVRAFGADMVVGDNPGGKVKGPVQFGLVENSNQTNQNHFPYALYKIDGLVSAILAEKTGFSDDDLKLLWLALENMFEYDSDAAAGGKTSVRKLIILKHKSSVGNAPPRELSERVKITRKDTSSTAKGYADYDIKIDRDNLSANLEICEIV